MTEVATGRRFRPTFWSSLAALAGIAILVSLGTWQVQRLHWKEALIAEITVRMDAPAVDLPAVVESTDDVSYRRYRATGRFRHEDELYIGSQTYRGQVGFRILTPLEFGDGRLVLIDRGWVPNDRQDPARRAQGQLEGTVTVEGFARQDGWTGSPWFRPDNRPEENYWFWVDLEAMARALDAPSLSRQFYIQAVASEVPGELPRGRQDGVSLRNDHLQYALTWYALAVVLLVIFVLFSWRGPDRSEPDRNGGAAT